MADDNKTKLNIRLHVYDEEMSVYDQPRGRGVLSCGGKDDYRPLHCLCQVVQGAQG